MMYNKYNNYDPTVSTTYRFYGLNRTRITTKGEMEDMENMGTLEYPCAAPRGPRKTIYTIPVNSTDRITAIHAPSTASVNSIKGITGICGGAFYYNGTKKSGDIVIGMNGTCTIVQTGNLYIINEFIDTSLYHYNMLTNTKTLIGKRTGTGKIYIYNIDTDNFSELGTIMNNLCLTSGSDENGNYLETYKEGKQELLDYSVTLNDGTVLSGSDYWNTFCNGSTLSPSVNIFENYFSIGDEVTISGFPTKEESVGQVWAWTGGGVTAQKNFDCSYNNTVDLDNYPNLDEIDKYTITQAIVKSFSSRYIPTSSKKAWVHRIYFTLTNKYNEEIDFEDMSGTNTSNEKYCMGITIRKRQHSYEHIATHHGRLWGVIPAGNMIYGSASDDYSETSVSSETNGFSVRLRSDTPGIFTGLCKYNDCLLAFKENSITIIYGGIAAETYGTETIHGIGCIDPKSIAVTPSGVIFLSYNGFYLYSGNTPQLLSARLNTKYKSATAGYDGNIYYASAKTHHGNCEFLTYDMRYSVWHMQDALDAVGMFAFMGEFYAADSMNIYLMNSTIRNDVNWSFTSARTHDNTLNEKSLNELWIRAYVEDGAYFTVYTKTDDHAWIEHATYNEPGLNIYRCSVRTLMGNNYRYKIEGKGNVVFYEIEVQKAAGGRRIKEFENTVSQTPSIRDSDVISPEIEDYQY